MFFLYDANLRILKTIPSNVYQGSDSADDIFFLIPANPNAAVDVSFLLPTGKTLVSRAATKQGEALGLATADGVKYAMWGITLTAQETAYAGNVTLQITLSTGITRKTSQKAVFPVLSGVPAILPDAPTKDVYADIQAAIAALQVVVYDTNSEGIAAYTYNNVDMAAQVSAFEENATRVVVPAYTIKDDIYYAVTGINAQLPASVTEVVFGKNVTAIGENAFRDTVIEMLEFPQTLTYIGDNAFYNAETKAFYFNGACPTLEKGVFAGVTATAYVPDEYFDDYSYKLSAWSGITVKKRSDTFKDLETAIAEEETARKAADEALQDELDKKINKTSQATTYERVYGVQYNSTDTTTYKVSSDVEVGTLVKRTDNATVKTGVANDENDAINLGQLTTKLLDYLLKSGGIISGDLSITGDLEVRGTTKTTEEETLAVKDSIVVTNSDGADLSSTLAGFVIRLNATDCYGIIYDASTESVKLGKGRITDGKFTFNSGEGNAVAVRADGSLMTDGHLVKWDATALKFVDAGKSVSDIVADAKTAVEEDNFQIVTTLSGSSGTLTDEEFEKLSNPYGHNYIIKYGNEMCKFAAVNSTSIYYKSQQSYTTTSITSIQITINTSTKAWTATTRMQNAVYANPSLTGLTGTVPSLSSIQIGGNKYKVASDLPNKPTFNSVAVGSSTSWGILAADQEYISGNTAKYAKLTTALSSTGSGLTYKFFQDTPISYTDNTAGYNGAVPLQGRYIHGSAADEYGLYLIKDNDYSTGAYNFITSYGNGASGNQKYVLPHNPNKNGEQFLLGEYNIFGQSGITVERLQTYGSGPEYVGGIMIGIDNDATVTIDGIGGQISLGTGLHMDTSTNTLEIDTSALSGLPNVPNDVWSPSAAYFLQGNGYSAYTPSWERFNQASVGTIKRGDTGWGEYVEGKQRIVDIAIMSAGGSNGSYYVSTPGFDEEELGGGEEIEVIFPKKSGTVALLSDIPTGSASAPTATTSLFVNSKGMEGDRANDAGIMITPNSITFTAAKRNKGSTWYANLLPTAIEDFTTGNFLYVPFKSDDDGSSNLVAEYTLRTVMGCSLYGTDNLDISLYKKTITIISETGFGTGNVGELFLSAIFTDVSSDNVIIDSYSDIKDYVATQGESIPINGILYDGSPDDNDVYGIVYQLTMTDTTVGYLSYVYYDSFQTKWVHSTIDLPDESTLTITCVVRTNQ